MDLTKDITYEQFKNLKFKKTSRESFNFNDILYELQKSPILLSISQNSIKVLKNEHGCTGELGTGELLNVLILLLGDTINSDIKLFKEAFLNDLHKAIQDILKRHQINKKVVKSFKRRS